MVYFWVNLVGLKKSAIFAPHSWRRVRVAEGARLESVYTPKAYREFESLRLRKLTENLASPGFFIGDGWGESENQMKLSWERGLPFDKFPSLRT